VTDPGLGFEDGRSNPEDTVAGRRELRRPGDVGRLTLVVVAHPDAGLLGRGFELTPGGGLTIGRARDADLSFPEPTEVSRRHARIWEEAGTVRVEDLGSRNGTFVNGQEVTAPRVLNNGDNVQIGPVYLKFFAGHHVERAYYDAMYELASRDELTGVHNRRKLDEELTREFALAHRYRRPLSLALLDIDGLKTINDRHGHRAGDAVLRQMADLVSASLRRETIFARMGGDEFAVLCPETNAASGEEMVARLRAVIDRHRFDVGGTTIRVSCSLGVAQLEPGMAVPDDLYQAADRSLYARKPPAGPPPPDSADFP
jgi:diguanylate cyclase (GGDEF)-like protein